LFRNSHSHVGVYNDTQHNGQNHDASVVVNTQLCMVECIITPKN